MNMTTANTARLLITCEDKPGIVQAVSSFLYHQGANITALDQYATAAQGGRYFMRVEFELDNLQSRKESIIQTFAANVAERYGMQWRLALVSDVKKVGILVSKVDHALLELLWRHARGGLPCEITKVVSNHETLREAVENFGIPFEVVPVTKDNKPEAYAEIDQLMQGNDLLVLARYMQILDEEFVSKWEMKVINIHHSFLPAFVGANPYKQAYEKGVKLIGATAHYVTADLDQGPIIEQDVERVNHDFTVEQLRELGQDVERNVLARAVKWHLEDRIIVDGNKTVVFQ
ncbi:formyltetrahydrofolate deformylase [Acinetobacter lwoffii]|jgi:formyltetrahydrofolate deformylase|uniref:Formyltetrahydrofolate deformylase n=3 Tax=Acinetobacter lwoffii TaxID=28090 RepID=A0A2K8ULH1_ACILW|nr:MULTISPECIES: formyltetrahydrofolate deformylase [Pseudomonadota]AUC06095.1 formyltetrahydrofolate deformylase [Acinetobacter lwoffii]ENU15682.1 formyltetrahydrofolate deformylase [Acinetobacter sp. CIP A162]ENW29684.1 formyltetrahydrofolate deformylase [Acinetobacter lwoffii NIPH 478]ESJ94117.1 formyltetrahydrofolate deformylase [Acinetobacter lwoffii NCTC 5866 = CIP 64.10 = NIPH 512]MBA4069952.1 formyltetrahydrofolate deformylase [Acinetobacter sp.]